MALCSNPQCPGHLNREWMCDPTVRTKPYGELNMRTKERRNNFIQQYETAAVKAKMIKEKRDEF